MKATVINLKLTKNIGNYQSVALGGEWSVDEDESIERAFTAAKAQLEQAFYMMYQQPQVEQQRTAEKQPQTQEPAQQQPTDNRPLVEFGTPLLKQICKRVQDTAVSMETIEKYYRLSDEARKVVEIAIKMK